MARRLSNLMEDFSVQHANSTRLDYRENSRYLIIDRPTTLAAFFAFCNRRSNDKSIYLRGTTEFHATAYPSLFRALPHFGYTKEQNNRWRAYKCAIGSLQNLKGSRWRRKDLGAVLQHYGIRTPWLDVVRNLYSAVWFATHELRHRGLRGKVRPTIRDCGWISFYRRRTASRHRLFELNDIAADHSSTHLRPHAQHGASLAMQSDGNELPNTFQDFNKYRVAHVCILCGEKWKLSGHMFSTEYMFPSNDLDDSFDLLSRSPVRQILRDACAEFGIASTSLGGISGYR